MMKKMCIIMAFVLASPATAQNSPSYDETVRFVTSKVAAVDGSVRFSLTFPNRCVMRTRDEHLRSSGSTSSLSVRSTHLGELDPSRIDVSSFKTVSLYTREDMKRVATSQRNFAKSGAFDPTFSFSGGHNLIFIRVLSGQDNENGNRVARAMRHLIDICGGKEELF